MGTIRTEGFEIIGNINAFGYIFDKADNCIAKISDSGYITQVGGGESYGKIDPDGTICDASGHVVGNIQADGYLYIHSKRVGKVDSEFIERITPDAIIYGDVSTYGGRKKTHQEQQETQGSEFSDNSAESGHSFPISLIIKLIIGLVMAVAVMINTGTINLGLLIICPIVVLIASFILKLFF